MNTIRFFLYAVCLAVLVACGEPSVSLNLAWVAPVENDDGSRLTSLAGYRIYRNGEMILDVSDPSLVGAEIDGRSGDTVWMTAYDAKGTESEPSNEVTLRRPVVADH